MPYEFKTTFWQDFTIADAFGADAVRDTYRRAFGEWKSDVVYVADLAMAMNMKCWQHHDAGNEELSKLYGELYYETDGYAYDTFKGDDLSYYFGVTD